MNRDLIDAFLGRQGSGLPVPLGFGAGSLGNLYRAVDDATAAASVDAGWDAGIRYFDTAPHYGLGLSERRLGAVLAGRPREDYLLSTKVGRLLVPNPAPTGSDLESGGFAVPDDLTRELDYSASGVRRSLEESLTRLGLDRVDIVYVHDPDDHVEQVLAEALPELIAMREEGIVGAVGVGMNQWQAPLRFVAESDLDVVMLAGRYTLLDRSGLPLLEACADRGVAVVCAAPFNSGLLARPDPSPDAHFNYAPATPELLDLARALADLAREHGAVLPQVAVQFPLRHDVVTTVVSGIGKPAYVATTLEWLDQPVPEAFWPEAEELIARAGMI